MTWINNAADATDGLNVYTGIAVGGISLLVLVLRNLALAWKSATAEAVQNAAATVAAGAASKTAAAGMSMLNMALSATIVGVAAAALVTVVGTLISIVDASKRATKETKELAETLESSRQKSRGIKDEIDKIEQLGAASNGTEEDMKALNDARADLMKKYP